MKILKLPTLIVLMSVLAACSVSRPPMSDVEIRSIIQKDRDAVRKAELLMSPYYRDGDVKNYTMTLDEAVRIALDANEEVMVARFGLVASQVEYGFGELDLLPTVEASSQYSARNNTPGSRGGRQSASDKRYKVDSVSASWNVLDFGASYYRARRLSTEALRQEEFLRQAESDLKFKVFVAYVTAASLQRAVEGAGVVLSDLERAVADVTASEGYTNDIAFLSSIKEAYVQEEGVRSLVWSYRRAMNDLGGILRQDLDYRLRLSLPELEVDFSSLEVDFSKLFEFSLMRRPEYRELVLSADGARDLATEELLRLLPGLDLSVSKRFSNDGALLNDSWVSFSTNFVADFINLFKISDTLEFAEEREKYEVAKRIGVYHLIKMQLLTAIRELKLVHEEYLLSVRQDDVEGKLLNDVSKRVAVGVFPEIEGVKSRASKVVTKSKVYEKELRMLVAWRRFVQTLGVSEFSGDIERLINGEAELMKEGEVEVSAEAELVKEGEVEVSAEAELVKEGEVEVSAEAELVKEGEGL